ncbi:hypothetical protein KQI36_16135, partial [Clostridium senegalense]
MLVEYVNGSISWYGAINRGLGILGLGNEAFSFFSNFFSNIVTAFTANGNVWEVVKMIPDFAFMLVSFVPAVKV